MTNEEEIEVLKEYLSKASLAWERQALKKAITTLQELQDKAKGEGHNGIMNNAEWCLNNGISFSDIQLRNRKQKYGGGYYVVDKNTDNKIGYIVPPETTESGYKTDAYYAFRLWLDLAHEYYISPEDILTNEERGYLKQVIAPFKNKVEWISKDADDCYNEKMYIYIKLCGDDNATLPSFFVKDNLFDGMELCKRYKLQELGL